jgi:hypothetical protein
LGIAEYFVFDCLDPGLRGYRLLPSVAGEARASRPIVPQGGRFASEVLGLDLMVDGARLRLMHGADPLPDTDQLVATLHRLIDDLTAQRQTEAGRAEAAEQRTAELERELAETRAEIERLNQPAEAAPRPRTPIRRVRFERYEGSGFPLRAVYDGGSWLGVNRENEGLFLGDAGGRIVQLLAKEEFRAVSPRQFAVAYKRVFGHMLSERAEPVGPGDVAASKEQARSS